MVNNTAVNFHMCANISTSFNAALLQMRLKGSPKCMVLYHLDKREVLHLFGKFVAEGDESYHRNIVQGL